MSNSCGNCKVCCTSHRIDKSEIFWKEEDKSVGVVCEKLGDSGCSVYEQRPPTCRRYECLWRQLILTAGVLQADFRPDNLNILVDVYYYKESDQSVFAVKELKPGLLDFNNLDTKIDYFFKRLFELGKQQKGTCVVVIYPFGSDKGYKLDLDI